MIGAGQMCAERRLDDARRRHIGAARFEHEARQDLEIEIEVERGESGRRSFAGRAVRRRLRRFMPVKDAVPLLQSGLRLLGRAAGAPMDARLPAQSPAKMSSSWTGSGSSMRAPEWVPAAPNGSAVKKEVAGAASPLRARRPAVRGAYRGFGRAGDVRSARRVVRAAVIGRPSVRRRVPAGRGH